jgi:hypothetical protein
VRAAFRVIGGSDVDRSTPQEMLQPSPASETFAMSEDEFMVFMLSLAAGFVGAVTLASSRLHPFHTHANAGIGLHRVVVLLSLLWTAWVIRYHGDPSITGFYVLFYLVMTYAVVKVFGQLFGPQALGFDLRREVFVGRNTAVALFTGSLALAAGLLIGGSLWGEADPLSDAEGGWWIPFGFFLLGWTVLMVATWLYVRRGGGRFRVQLRREHDLKAATTGAVFVLASTTLILQGVAGDFWGWREGLLSMSTIAVMLLGHEWIARYAEPSGETGPLPGSQTGINLLEQGFYIALAVAGWFANRWISDHYTQTLAGV